MSDIPGNLFKGYGYSYKQNISHQTIQPHFFPKLHHLQFFFVFQKTNFCDIAFSCCFVSEVPSMPSVGWAVKTTGTTWKWTTLTSISSTISMLDKFLDSRMTSCRKLKQEISEQKIKGPKQV